MSSLVAAKDAESDEDDVPLLVPVDAEPPADEAVRSDAVTDKPSSIQGKEEQKVVPVTIITGCLGAGKTTLLNHILTSAHGKRIAVIENEFGQGLGIESAIARDGSDGSSLSEFMELANGCICCSVKSDLVATLEGLVERCGHRIDYIIIETSGMAHPGPVASCLWVDEMLESALVLDGIVTVIDAKHFDTQLDEHGHGKQQHEAAMQVGFADRLLLNKVDLVEGEAPLVALETRLRRMNGVAQLARTTRGKVDLDFILGLGAYATQGGQAGMTPGYEALVKQGGGEEGCEGEGCGGEEGCGHTHEHKHEHRHEHKHEHSSGIGTVAWVEEGWEVQGEAQVTKWLGQWLWREDEGGRRGKGGVEVYRLKGVVGVRGGGRLLLQGVHEAFEVTPLQVVGEEEQKGCRVVVIGQGVEGAGTQLRHSFYHECCQDE